MENSVDTTKQNSITNTFIEQFEISLGIIQSIMKIFEVYDTNASSKNYDLEMEFELTKLNLGFLESILSCFMNYKQEVTEPHKNKMLKLFDFILYELKRLRNKFEEVSDFYFSIDEENKYIRNIKNFMDTEELKPTKLGCLYLRLLNHYLRKLNKRLKSFMDSEFQINQEKKDKFLFANSKIHFLSKVVSHYLNGSEESLRKAMNSNELSKLVMSEFNELSFNSGDSAKWAIFFKNLIKNLYSKIKLDRLSTKKVISTLKVGFKTVMNIFTNNDSEELLDTMPNINLIKVLFEAFESKLLSLPVSTQMETTKTNEVVFLPKKNFENFRLLSEKDGLRRNNGVKNLMKVRLVTNQLVKINYEYQNLFEKKKEEKFREVNFFGLLLRVSKDFLTPSFNVILHIPGGGFFSQSSESHLDYLSKWANQTDSVIISMDYKLSTENKYPILLDECIKAYELIVNYSVKLFGFNINKLVIYCDSVGSLVAFDLIKHAIKNNIKKPDAAVLIFPYPNIIIEELNFHKDPFSFFGLDENMLEIPLHLKLQDMFLDFSHINEEQSDKSFKTDDRLNFFLSDALLVSKFPKTFIISSANEPFREDCTLLAEFLLENKVEVKIDHLVYFFNGFLQIPSLFDSNSDKSLDLALNYILEFFKPNSSKLQKRKFSRSSGTTISSFSN